MNKMKNGTPPKGMPGNGMQFKRQNPIPTLMRVLRFVIKDYPFSCLIVFICLIASAVTTAYGTMFFKTLIADFIEPMLNL